ncbi:MAG: hypothetical protein EZS28_006242, partial [Streblomastix strix]
MSVLQTDIAIDDYYQEGGISLQAEEGDFGAGGGKSEIKP